MKRIPCLLVCLAGVLSFAGIPLSVPSSRPANGCGVAPSPSTSDAPLAPLPLGPVWRFFGDSQTAGAAEESSARSHAIALRNVWQGSFGQPWPTVTIHGLGGCSLAQSTERYANLTSAEKQATTFIHVQESGNQQIDGQRTAAEFAATFETFIRTVATGSPNAIISYETAYSFQREASAGRNWNPYNVALRDKIDALRSQGFVIHLTDTDAKAKALVAALGFNAVIKEDGGHYRGNGNLLIALSILDTFGYDIAALNLSSIPDDQVTPAHKQLCVSIAAGTASASLRVTSPNGSESWRRGETHQITWTAAGVTENLVIELMQGPTLLGVIAAGIPPTLGTLTWTVGQLVDGTFRTGQNLKIRIRTASGRAVAEAAWGIR